MLAKFARCAGARKISSGTLLVAVAIRHRYESQMAQSDFICGR